MSMQDHTQRTNGQPGDHNFHTHIPDARTFDQMDADDAAYEEAVREIALGLPGRPGVIR